MSKQDCSIPDPGSKGADDSHQPRPRPSLSTVAEEPAHQQAAAAASGNRLHVLTDQYGRTHLVRETPDALAGDGHSRFDLQPSSSGDGADEVAIRRRRRQQAEEEAAAVERRRPGKKGGVVVYEFRPRYPLLAKAEDVVGGLATSKEHALRLALAAFPTLRTIEDPDRIAFSIDAFPGSSHWARVLDDGWPALAVELPRRIRIQVVDRPGDKEARFRHSLVNIATGSTIVGGIAFALVAAVSFLCD